MSGSRASSVAGGLVDPTGSRTRSRQRFYQQLFLIMAGQMLIMTLPYNLHRFGMLWTCLMLLILLIQLGRRKFDATRFSYAYTRIYRALGIISIGLLLSWLFTTDQQHLSGLLLFIVLTSFIFWSLLRLLVLLRQEPRVTRSVLAGAVAGYLMLGISGGLLLCVLETMQPGSFIDLVAVDHSRLLDVTRFRPTANQAAWTLDFSRLNYFAFSTLTTAGYGDIVPVHRVAQLACNWLSMLGPLYIAIVMGLLISRFTVETSELDELEDKDGRP